ncbi:alpha/beta fold hydrolase [Micromonospora rifamycinica]|uniref:Pimeloyl-ACP methyl ester carboxylesterase n=1 Tax=Micromonospora rifamycinica TaxID=291594 RepID=A0A120FA35_9ACTN|nr:alpha/beta hydrolase [Micromonospora rifamycinica]KWV34264.1 alpha/beta hydrolase [Micromonospora rifamycinica]SCG35033.1 Pimeloyl-ACP methyl ester carboxylesterase [Micromonospora rifamycinica]
MSITTARPGRPTVVLVHGAFAESASWDGVIAGLIDAGYPAVALANPLRGVRHDADHLRAVLTGIEGPVVLVGHSYGGMVISNVPTAGTGVTALVYVGAFAPEPGESAADLAGRFPGSSLGETLATVALPGGGTDLYIRQDRYHHQFAADSTAQRAAVMAVTQRPITGAALNEPSGEPAWRSLPSWFLFGSEDLNIPVAAHRFMAERAGSRRTVELPGGSHTVAIPEAAQLVALIREAADAT